MALVRVDAVLFDGFGTLVSMEPPGPNLVRALAERGVRVSEERAAAAFRAEIGYYLEHQLEGRDARSLHALRDRCAEVLRAELGDAALDLATAREAMLESIRFHAYADAAPALRELRARGLRLVVASNWDCTLPLVLDEAGLSELVDGVVSSAAAGARKPDPRLFRAALELAGAAPERAVHVGDSPANDVAGAAAAGIAAVLLRRPGRRPDRVAADAAAHPAPVAEIAGLDELPRIL